MIYFIYGEDSYRSKRKLEEIIDGYRKVHKSGLNLAYIDADEKDFKTFLSGLNTNSMFSEKKLIVLKNVFDNKKFQEEFLNDVKKIEDLKDIVIVYESNAPDQRTKIFKELQKRAKCQEFKPLQPAGLRKWVEEEIKANNAKIDVVALDFLVSFVKNDLWQMANEINKLSNYKRGGIIKKEDVELLVKPNIENDIFKTIDAIASKDKKQALNLLHKYLDDGERPLYLLSMISYQFRNLLSVKESGKNCGLHPFVFQKTYYLCQRFSMQKLKDIYWKIFQTDSDIKTGKIEPETALDLLLSEI